MMDAEDFSLVETSIALILIAMVECNDEARRREGAALIMQGLNLLKMDMVE